MEDTALACTTMDGGGGGGCGGARRGEEVSSDSNDDDNNHTSFAVQFALDVAKTHVRNHFSSSSSSSSTIDPIIRGVEEALQRANNNNNSSSSSSSTTCVEVEYDNEFHQTIQSIITTCTGNALKVATERFDDDDKEDCNLKVLEQSIESYARQEIETIIDAAIGVAMRGYKAKEDRRIARMEELEKQYSTAQFESFLLPLVSNRGMDIPDTIQFNNNNNNNNNVCRLSQVRMEDLARQNGRVWKKYKRDNNRRVANNNNRGGGKKKTCCCICQCESYMLPSQTLSCVGGAGDDDDAHHDMCMECSEVFCRSVMADLHSNYPPKCSICKLEIPMNRFTERLTDAQRTMVMQHAHNTTLPPHLQLIQCNQCDYFETVDKPGPSSWFCAWCGWGKCFVCHEELPRKIRHATTTAHYQQFAQQQQERHDICESLRFVKAKIEQAIEEGSQMKCPSCGLAGRKDDACTHMSCPKCEMDWCYVCGLGVTDCDKALPQDEGLPVQDIYLHNEDWERNPKRCPMYLCQILEVDPTWINGEEQEDDFEDDDKCLDHFHRLRTIRKLQEVRKEVGRDEFKAVFRHFPSIRNSGFRLREIRHTNTDQLFDREDYLRRLAEDQEEDQEREGNDNNPQNNATTRNNNADDDDDEEATFEEVPEEMTRAVLQEEEQVRQAIVASLEEQLAVGNGGQTNAAAEGGDIIPNVVTNDQDTTTPQQEHRTTSDEAGTQNNNLNDDEDDSDDDIFYFEEVPEAMTGIIVQEEQDLQRAREASHYSAREDELLRRTIIESATTTIPEGRPGEP